jgi:integrase
MPLRLTKTAIDKAILEAKQGGRRDLADDVLPGLRMRVTPGGSSSWVLACRDQHGRMRRFPVGTYPRMGVAEAREKARALRVQVREQGADPVAQRRRMRAIGQDAKAGIGTLSALLDLYGGRLPKSGKTINGTGATESSESDATTEAPRAIGPGRDLKSWPECRRRIESVFARHLQRPLASLTAGELQMTADAYPAKQSAAAAVRYIRPILKWGAARNYVSREAAMIEPPATVRRRDRVLTREELKLLLPAIAESTHPYQRALFFMLLTLARREEVCAARWRDVDFEAAEWRIPRPKNKVPHRVPLSRQALDLLQGMERGASDALIFATATGGHLANWDRETKTVMKKTDTAKWNRHDLRRTGATLLGELGIDPHVIEAALNHVVIHSGLATLYNQARYLSAVKYSLQCLANHLDELLDALPNNRTHRLL